jgi:hypothetical protein
MSRGRPESVSTGADTLRYAQHAIPRDGDKSMNKLMFALVLGASSAVAVAGTPVADQRQQNQEERIEQGEASGELTKREEARLDAQQDRIENKEERFKSDGVVTKSERVRLQRSENRASRNIARQKHDRQDRD